MNILNKTPSLLLANSPLIRAPFTPEEHENQGIETSTALGKMSQNTEAPNPVSNTLRLV